MAQTYTLNKSPTTGWWNWGCKNSSQVGSTTSKSASRAEAKSACGSAFRVTPPDVSAEVVGGNLSRFTIVNLNNQTVTFSVDEIRQEAFCYFYGLDCAEPDKLTDAEKAITILKICGIYRGGQTVEQIKTLHSLSPDQFRELTNRQYNGLVIHVNDDHTMRWEFPNQPVPPKIPPLHNL